MLSRYHNESFTSDASPPNHYCSQKCPRRAPAESVCASHYLRSRIHALTARKSIQTPDTIGVKEHSFLNSYDFSIDVWASIACLTETAVNRSGFIEIPIAYLTATAVNMSGFIEIL